jgi:hypothetical protein
VSALSNLTFISGLHNTQRRGGYRKFNDKVTQNVAAGAEATGRVWAMMYDISGSKDTTVLADLKKDWEHLVNDLHITSGDRYLHHRGNPILSIWGMGFSSRDVTAKTATKVQDYFESMNVTLMGGTPTGWRDLSKDSMTDKVGNFFSLSQHRTSC